MRLQTRFAVLLLPTIFLGGSRISAQDRVDVPAKWLSQGRQEIESLRSRNNALMRENGVLKKSKDEMEKALQREILFSTHLQQRSKEKDDALIECRRNVDLLAGDIKYLTEQQEKAVKKQKRKGGWNTVAGVLSGIGLGIVAGFILAQ